MQDPVKVKAEFNKVSDTEAEIVFSATIEQGWHVYSTDLGSGGPISATFNVESSKGIKPEGKLVAEGKEISTFDKMFEMTVRYFTGSAKFVQKLTLTGGDYDIEGYLEYGACNDQNCLPPTQSPFRFKGTADGVASADVESAADSTAVISSAAAAPGVSDLWSPVIDELNSFGSETISSSNMSWIYIFFTGLVGGFLALFTPCVWPIIPMTVSFFLKRSKDDKKKGIRDAWTYGAQSLSSTSLWVWQSLPSSEPARSTPSQQMPSSISSSS
jgi:thiol:disulfide interchange protein DsbD